MGLWGQIATRRPPVTAPPRFLTRPGFSPDSSLCAGRAGSCPQDGSWNQGGVDLSSGWRNREKRGRHGGQDGRMLARMAVCRHVPEPLTAALTPSHAARSVSCRPQPRGPHAPRHPTPSSRAISAARSQGTLPIPSLPNLQPLHPPRYQVCPRGRALALPPPASLPTWTQVTCTPAKAGLDPHRDVS